MRKKQKKQLVAGMTRQQLIIRGLATILNGPQEYFPRHFDGKPTRPDVYWAITELTKKMEFRQSIAQVEKYWMQSRTIRVSRQSWTYVTLLL